jgi:hypothetical protein
MHERKANQTIERPSPDYLDPSGCYIGQRFLDVCLRIEGLQPISVGPDKLECACDKRRFQISCSIANSGSIGGTPSVELKLTTTAGNERRRCSTVIPLVPADRRLPRRNEKSTQHDVQPECMIHGSARVCGGRRQGQLISPCLTCRLSLGSASAKMALERRTNEVRADRRQFKVRTIGINSKGQRSIQRFKISTLGAPHEVLTVIGPRIYNALQML